jgi:hypothetical protein
MRPMLAASKWGTIWAAFRGSSATLPDYVTSITVPNPSAMACTASNGLGCYNTGTTIKSGINNPAAIAVDGQGNVFVANAGASTAVYGTVTEYVNNNTTTGAAAYSTPCTIEEVYQPQTLSITGSGANEVLWVGTLKNPNNGAAAAGNTIRCAML